MRSLMRNVVILQQLHLRWMIFFDPPSYSPSSLWNHKVGRVLTQGHVHPLSYRWTAKNTWVDGYLLFIFLLLFDSVNQALGNASIYWCSQPSMSFFIARKSPVLRLHISCQSNYLSLPCSFLLYFLFCCQPIWFCFETGSSSLTTNLHTKIHHKMVW